MFKLSSYPLIALLISYLVALLLTIAPIFPASTFIYWIPLVLIYWILHYPEKLNFSLAWLSGILLDLFSGSFLGIHALALSIVAFIAMEYKTLRSWPILLQTLVIFLLLIIYQFILATVYFLIQGILTPIQPVLVALTLSSALWFAFCFIQHLRSVT
jgi:rod shape-determining protein MreD